MMKQMYYKCFSINQLRFIKIHGIKPVSKGIHPNGKTFWVFDMNDELSAVLTTWTKNKVNKSR
jgi:hypothetical protein